MGRPIAFVVVPKEVCSGRRRSGGTTVVHRESCGGMSRARERDGVSCEAALLSQSQSRVTSDLHVIEKQVKSGEGRREWQYFGRGYVAPGTRDDDDIAKLELHFQFLSFQSQFPSSLPSRNILTRPLPHPYTNTQLSPIELPAIEFHAPTGTTRHTRSPHHAHYGRLPRPVRVPGALLRRSREHRSP